jgi:hypothetical protein
MRTDIALSGLSFPLGELPATAPVEFADVIRRFIRTGRPK